MPIAYPGARTPGTPGSGGPRNAGGMRARSDDPWARLRRLYGGARGEGARFILYTLLLALVALCGGSSRSDAWQTLLLRPGAVLLATAILILPGSRAGPSLRMPMLLLAAFALVIVVQLVPLPPTLWAALPGHAPYLEAAAMSGAAQPWRPITLSVDLTLNSLISLTVPAALLLGAVALRPDQRTACAGLMLSVGVSSAVVGLLQVTLGGPYLYSPPSIGRPVGLFANINHQAAVLAAIIPLAAGWGVSHHGPAPIRRLIAAATGLLLLATVLVTGSRGGLLLAVLATLSVPLVIGNRMRLMPRTQRLVAIGAAAALVGLVVAIWAAGRLGALDRLLESGADQRVTFLPITWSLLRDYAPFGSGFGTFDLVFRRVEPDAVLNLTYFNHAHNDLLELGITGGAAAVAVALAGLLWLARRGVALWGAERGSAAGPLARAGLSATLLLLLASLTDYPLRAPLAIALLALAGLWAAGQHMPAE